MTTTRTQNPEIVPVTLGKQAARATAEALRTFEGADAIARFRAEHGGWHVLVRGAA